MYMVSWHIGSENVTAEDVLLEEDKIEEQTKMLGGEGTALVVLPRSL